MEQWAKVSWLAGTSLAAVIALAGCGSGGGVTSNNSGSSTGSAGSSQKPLVMLPSPYGSFQNNFNPFQGQSANPGTNGFIYQPLYYFNLVGSQSYPLLAKSYAWSNNDLTLTVNLRQNAKWTDGTPFTAKDVVFTFNLLKQYPAADTNGVWQQLSSVQANGDYQVVFQFKKVNVPFATYVLETDIVPEHIWSTLGDPTKVSLTNWVGIGPYTLTNFTPQGYTFKANSNYYLGKPSVNEIQIPAYNGNDSADLALSKGQVDWGGVMIPSVQQVYASHANNHYWYPPSNVIMLYTDLKDPLLSQLPVRQAMSMGIDRNVIATKGEYGYTQPASTTGLILPNNQSWLDPNLSSSQTTFQYNPQGAQKILENAGYKKNSSGIFVSPSGQPLNFTLQVVSGWSDWDASSALISQQLKAIGINVQVQQEQFGAYMNNLQSHKYQLAMSWTNAGPTPYFLYQNLLNSKGGWNLEQWNNAATDQALNSYSQTTDATAQQQAIYKLENIMINQLPSIPLFYGPYWYEYNDSHFTGWPTATNTYVTPTPYSWPAPAIVVMNLKPVK